MAQLGQAGAPPAPEHPPAAGPADCLAQVGGAQAAQRVGSRAPASRAVGPIRTSPSIRLRQVDAEERQRGVGHRVDQRPDQVAAGRDQPQVGAAEGDDAGIGVGARAHREAVRPGPRAADGVAGLGDPLGVVDRQRARAGAEPLHLAAGRDRAAALEQVRGVGAGDGAEVDDPGPRRVQAGDPGGVRLDARGSRRRRASAARRPRSRRRVAPALRGRGARAASVATISLPQRSKGISGCFAVLVEQRGAAHAELGLQRARRVVDPGVDDARVVAGLVGRRPRLLLEHADALGGAAAAQLAGDGEADDATADDGDVAARGSRGVALGGRAPARGQSRGLGYDGSMRASPQREASRHAAMDGPGLEIVIVSSTGALELLRACLRQPAREPIQRRADAGPRRRQRQHRRHAGDGPRGVPRGDAARARLELRLLLRQQRRPARGLPPLRPAPQPRHRGLPRRARPHDGADGGGRGHRDVDLPAGEARRQARPRLEKQLPDPARRRSATGSAWRTASAGASPSTTRPSWASASSATSSWSAAPSC